MTDKFAWDDDEFEIVDPERTDWDPDQPRDADGKFSSGGGGGGGGDFKVKESLGTVGKAREAAYSPPKWNSEGGPANSQARRAEEGLKANAARIKAEAPNKYNGADEAAKALAGRDAGVEEYRKQLAANPPEVPPSGLSPLEAYHAQQDLNDKAWEQRERGQLMQANEQALSEQGHEGHEAPNTLRAQQNLPDPDFGAMKFIGKEAKQLDDRIQEALKNNAKLGDAGKEPARVVAEVHERIAKEKADEIAFQAKERERIAKLEVVRKEREARINSADDKVDKAADARRQAVRDRAEAIDKVQAARSRMADESEIAKLNGKVTEAQAAYEKAQEAQTSAIAAREALDPQAPERTSSAKNLSDLAGVSVVETQSLGGGANASSVAILSDNSKAVYKPVDGERGGLRKNVDAGTYYLREAAASVVAEQLGVTDLVPATVVHDGPSGPGSLQAFVPDAETLYNSSGSVMFERDAAERMRVFDWITGNSDRHPGNVMAVTKDHDQEEHTLPILIDNGLSFPKGMPQRMITPYDNIPHEPISDRTVSLINGIDHVRLASTLASTGLEKQAVRYSIARAAMVQENPQMLSGASRHTASYDWDEVPEPVHEDLEKADKVLSDPAVTAAFERGEPIYAAAMARKAE